MEVGNAERVTKMSEFKCWKSHKNEWI